MRQISYIAVTAMLRSSSKGFNEAKVTVHFLIFQFLTPLNLPNFDVKKAYPRVTFMKNGDRSPLVVVVGVSCRVPCPWISHCAVAGTWSTFKVQQAR